MFIIKMVNKETESRIGCEGALFLSEALKANTTLTALYLGSEHQQESTKQEHDNDNKLIDNGLWDEEACELSEALRVNTTLITLDLRREHQR